MIATKNTATLIVAGIVGIAMAVALVVGVGAQTVKAQGVSLSQLVELFISLGIIAPEKAAAARAAIAPGGAAGASITVGLKQGDTGAAVKALQQTLNNKGYTVASTGAGSPGKESTYFGGLTKAALMRYQVAMGVAATGMVDEATLAKLNGTAATPAAGTPAAGTPASTSGTGITTPGVEGTLAATQTNAGLPSTLYEGDTMKGVLGVKLEAKNSDLAVQRVKLDLGTDTKVYNKIFKKFYVTDGTTVYASSDANSSTVVKDSSRYYLTISGFNLLIPKGGSKNLVIKADLHPTIDSTDYDTETYTIRYASNGIRAIDGAGIDQYATDTSITRTPTIAADLSESATLTVGLNSSSPKKQDVVATAGSSENELDKLTILVFDVKAEKDDVKITDMVFDIEKSGSGGATASTTMYLFEGSTELDSASITSSRTATFSDVDYVVPKNTTKTLTAKIDIRNANSTVARFVASTTASGITSENSKGDGATESGSATSYSIGLRNVGPEVSLVSSSITTNGVPQSDTTNSLSTSTLTATFNLKIKAVGGALTFGTVASSTPAFASSTTGFKVYRNGAYDGSVSSSATTTSYATPSGVTTSGLTESWTLPEGNEVTVPVQFSIVGRTTSGATLTRGGIYAIGLEGIQYNTGAAGSAFTQSFMAGETDWRTSGVSFP